MGKLQQLYWQKVYKQLNCLTKIVPKPKSSIYESQITFQIGGSLSDLTYTNKSVLTSRLASSNKDDLVNDSRHLCPLIACGYTKGCTIYAEY